MAEMTEKKIFVVDDYPYAAYITKKTISALSKHDCTVVDFESPVLLLDRFKLEFEDILMVITDYEMPNLRGDELIEELRKIKPDIKIVVMSAWLDTSKEEDEMLIGKQVKAQHPDLILEKPFPENWVGKIDTLLEQVA
ncbi:MAG: Unknown protein [uncultured Sulfurovum sp.]|uniref:Response regulatory domain-containing protein n=1 Tax=uncultured Sulfurovum sp. TaxID=269237 RepID=A0A6S6TE16_9BACT|nr:MAG: Unknown protein [uncultured Sulfurovum sp.]